MLARPHKFTEQVISLWTSMFIFTSTQLYISVPELGTRNMKPSCFVFRLSCIVYCVYKHNDFKSKHETNTKKLNKHEKIENSIEH